MVGDLNRVPNMRYLINQGRRRVIHRVRDQFVRTQVSETDVCAGNHFPKEQLLESLQPSDEVKRSELLVRDLA